MSIHNDIYGASSATNIGDNSTQRAADHGLLELGPPVHKTSVHECSCQFFSCFGMPCRHSIYIMLIEGYNGVSVFVLFH